MAFQTYWATALALHPGALHTSMPWVLQYSVSIWSMPMVAVPINETLLFLSSSSLHFVRVRIINASASATVSGVIDLPLIYCILATLSKISRMYGMSESMIIVFFIVDVMHTLFLAKLHNYSELFSLISDFIMRSFFCIVYLILQLLFGSRFINYFSKNICYTKIILYICRVRLRYLFTNWFNINNYEKTNYLTPYYLIYK